MGAEFADKNNKWKCAKCGEELTLGKVNLTYLNGNFEVELLKCEKCGMVLITEELATGKMLEVEKSLEDK
ncbi:MAG: DVU_1557 family redox protein [Solirubrobacterales bacterium]